MGQIHMTNYVIKSQQMILHYSGLTSDAEKFDIKNVLDKWGQADVVIDSLIIEAGVSFN